MIDNNNLIGIFEINLWDSREFEQYKNSGLVITKKNLISAGLDPINTIINKNTVTNDGLRWNRGQMLRTPKYMSKIGDMTLVGYQTASIPNSTKRMVLSEGNEPGMIVQDAWWSNTEINNVYIEKVSIYTYVDGTTPPEAQVILYAQTTLPSDKWIYKTGSNPQSLTVTRYEYLRNG